MTKEEKDAIEYFKNRIDICLDNANNCEEMDFDEEATYLRKEAIKIETVLNLIQKQQEELEKKDKYIKDMCENYCPKLMAKDKIIDLMARAWKQDDIRSIEEIKEDFRKKAEEENERI